MMIRYRAAVQQLPQTGSEAERLDLLAAVVLPSEDVLRASLTVARRYVSEVDPGPRGSDVAETRVARRRSWGGRVEVRA